jgi:hypothetical protein
VDLDCIQLARAEETGPQTLRRGLVKYLNGMTQSIFWAKTLKKIINVNMVHCYSMQTGEKVLLA